MDATFGSAKGRLTLEFADGRIVDWRLPNFIGSDPGYLFAFGDWVSEALGDEIAGAMFTPTGGADPSPEGISLWLRYLPEWLNYAGLGG